MGNLTTAFVFVWVLNILMFLSQIAIADLGTDTITMYNCSGTLLEEYADGSCTAVIVPDSGDFVNQLPEDAKTVEPGSDLSFLDPLAMVKNWIKEKIDYFSNILLAPYTILKSIPGIPSVLVGTLSLFWYAISLFLLVAFILGRIV